MTPDIAYAIAILATSALAWDFGKRWLAERAHTRTTDAQVLILESSIEDLRVQLSADADIRNKLAADWHKKFTQLENDWKQLREHANSQFAGALAQVESQRTRGFGR